MGFYRATRIPMTAGKNPGPRAYDFSDQPERQKLEDFLESNRPSTSHSRLTSWFACDKPGKSARYLDAEITFKPNTANTGEPLLFVVEMTSPSKQPMILVNAIRERLAAGDTAAAELLACEYWQASREWRFWEYTSPEIVVVEQLPWPDTIEQSLASLSYQADAKTLMQMYNCR
jgi:hypothetical protein